MSDQDAPVTLDQLRVFLAVVEEGSFSSAAKRLRRVQSAISYSIANLERLLEVELFDRAGRRPVLTEAGRALIGDARGVDSRVDRLHARARSIAIGVEPRVCFAVDALYPMPRLLAVLRHFAERYPGVDMKLRSESLGAVTHLVSEGRCHFGVSGPMPEFPRSLSSRPLTRVSLIPVCAPGHGLALAAAARGEDRCVECGDGSTGLRCKREDILEEVQVVVTDRSELTDGEDRVVLSDRTWRVADLMTKRALLVGGFGWGHLPTWLAEPAVEAGELVSLCIENQEAVDVGFFALTRVSAPPGPAGTWLLDALGDRAAAES